jgi:carotenoid cleavage dioxygenase
MSAINYRDSLVTTARCLGDVPLLDDAPDWIYRHDNPYLHGIYAPQIATGCHPDVVVEGELPLDLQGAYIRNGANPVFEPAHRYHPFDGDGMLHTVCFAHGKAHYSNAYVDTVGLAQERQQSQSTSPGVMGPFDYSKTPFGIKDTSNTDVVYFNNALMSLWYNAGHAYRVNPETLKTEGYFELTGRPSRRLSAHSKVDPHTGELIFFDYGDEHPYLTVGVADKTGQCVHETAIELPGPRLPHDIGVSRHYTVVHDLPFFHDLGILRRHGYRVLTFHRDLPIRFGVLPRHGNGREVRWFECEPGYILHVSNCWESGDWLIMDGCRSTNPMPESQAGEGELASMLAYMRLEANNYRWQFNLRTGAVKEYPLDDLNTEFNKINPLFLGLPSRYAYHQRIPTLKEGGHTLRFTGLVKYNNETGERWYYPYGEGVLGSEAVFAPKAGWWSCTEHEPQDEDDGYVITIVTDTRRWVSEAWIFDARDIEIGPIAKVVLPYRVPAGFHATWAPGVFAPQ